MTSIRGTVVAGCIWFFLTASFWTFQSSEEIFKDFQMELPLASRLHLMAGRLWMSFGWLIGLLLALGVPFIWCRIRPLPAGPREPAVEKSKWIMAVSLIAAALCIILCAHVVAYFLPMQALMGGISGKP